MYETIVLNTQIDKSKNPIVFINQTNGVKFKLHQHSFYGEKWFLSCKELGIEMFDLKSENIEEAKKEGIEVMKKFLKIAIKKYQKAFEEIN